MSKVTLLGIWIPLYNEDIAPLFQTLTLMGLKEGQTLLDLGSGDGKVVLAAALSGLQATGIEIDPELISIAKEVQVSQEIKNARFIEGNYFDYSWEGYDYIFTNPDKTFFRGMEEKLQRELTGILVVYGDHFLPQQLELTTTIPLGPINVRIYCKTAGSTISDKNMRHRV